MIEYLLNLISNQGVKLPAVFTYTSTKMMLAALTSLLLTIVLGPKFIRMLYALKIGQKIRQEECPMLGKLHEKKKDTPTMGGILILFSVIVSGIVWMNFSFAYSWLLLATSIALGLIGGVDDYLKLKYKNAGGLRSRYKFLLQLIVAAGVSLFLLLPQIHLGFESPIAKTAFESFSKDQFFGLYFFPFVKNPIATLSGCWLILSFIFFCFVITGSSNAVNFSDGLDGLASGLIVMVSLVFALVAFLMNHYEISRYLNIVYMEGSSEIAIFLCAIAGATLGFLWFNGYPAQVFMGDVGSLSIGGLLGLCAILLRREFLLALVGGIFVLEAISVILQVASFRLRKGKRIFLCAPIHHHFEYQGHHETKIVLRFWIVAFILAVIGLASLKFQ